MRVLGIVVLTLGVTVGAMFRVADTIEQIDRAGAFGGLDGLRERAHLVRERLQQEYPRGMIPSRVSEALAPFFPYVNRCTSRQDRLLVNGDDPDVYVLARRGFAGGHVAFMPGFYSSTAEQLQTVARLRAQSVPFALLSLETYAEFRGGFPLIDDYIQQRYRILTDIPAEEIVGVRVLVQRDRPAVRVDAATGWPCFQ